MGATACFADDGCMDCHSDPDLTIYRDGREVSLRVEEGAFEHSSHAGFACADCHTGLDAELFPHADPIPRVACIECHFDAGDTHPFHPEVGELRPGGPIAEAADCVKCHGTHEVKAVADAAFPFTSTRQVSTCGDCHTEAAASYVVSAHARSLLEHGPAHSPDCLHCHRVPEIMSGNGVLDQKLAQVNLCSECHRDDPEVAGKTLFGMPFITAFENSVHGQALVVGNADAPACSDCHGAHGVDRAVNAGSLVSRVHVSATCATCHPDAAQDLSHSAHGQALARGNRDAPTCTDCHGEHDILASTDPRSPVSARNLAPQLCGECHGSVRLAERYGIAANTFSTFADSFHGLAGRAGSVEVVNCASCHGYHNVLNSSHPESLVHPDNLAATCGACHPGANERFAIGKVHVALDRSSEEPVLYWIATIYTWLIVIVIGGMVLHNQLDYIKKVRLKTRSMAEHAIVVPGLDRRRIHPHRQRLRMTVNERLQHGIFAASFVLLVITGFMLRYPEAWWVESLRRINENLFEWRSLIHRIAGVVMLAGTFWHLGYIAFTRRGREQLRAIWPRLRDGWDCLQMIRYNMGLSRHKPAFDRFSYFEKAEYWAMVWGTLLMLVTGFLLWFDDFTMGLFTKLGFDIFRAIHFYEAILATLAIVVWHFYFVIFNPDVYPMNTAWLTGNMTEEEMASEHPLELKRILDEENKAQAERENR